MSYFIVAADGKKNLKAVIKVSLNEVVILFCHTAERPGIQRYLPCHPNLLYLVR